MRYYKLPEIKLAQLVTETLLNLLKSSKPDKVTIDVAKLVALPKPKQKIQVTFSEDAWLRIQTLVDQCDLEIAWHGVVTQVSQTEYYISEVLCYPQIITGGTVDSNDEGYAEWRDTLTDEQYNNLRMQGHSHVNMPIGPSSKDTDFYALLAQHIKDYFIFMIANKQKKMWMNVCDIANNVVYESEDIDILYESEGFDYAQWYKNIAEMYLSTAKPKAAVITKLPESKSHAYGDYESDSAYSNRRNY